MAETDRYSLGLQYEFNLEVTQLVPKDEQNKPIVTDKVYLDKTWLSYIDSGPIELVIENLRTGSEESRFIRSDFGIPLGELPIGTNLDQERVYTESGRRLLLARGRAEDIAVKIQSNNHLGLRIAAIQQEGTVTP